MSSQSIYQSGIILLALIRYCRTIVRTFRSKKPLKCQLIAGFVQQNGLVNVRKNSGTQVGVHIGWCPLDTDFTVRHLQDILAVDNDLFYWFFLSAVVSIRSVDQPRFHDSFYLLVVYWAVLCKTTTWNEDALHRNAPQAHIYPASAWLWPCSHEEKIKVPFKHWTRRNIH